MPERLIVVTIEQVPGRGLQPAGSTPRGYARDRGYRVSPRAARAATKLARAYGLRQVDGWPIEALGVHCVVYEVPEGRSPDELLALLSEDPRVESAQPMHMFETMDSAYNDPYLPLQSGLRSLQVEAAHRWSRGEGVKVAVVDTGIDQGHPDLEGRIAAARDLVGTQGGHPVGERHGTAVAGVIVSAADNGLGIVGVAPAARIVALRGCWEREAGAAVCTSFTLAKALAAALDERPGILNLSLSGPSDPLLGRLLRRIVAAGIIVIAAADREEHGPGFPASHPGVIAVQAALPERSPAFSGPAFGGVSAPGLDILTTLPHATWEFMSGSSLAAAHVAGIAALLLARQPRLPAERVRELLRASAEEPARVGLAAPQGAGVNACAALAALLGEKRDACATTATAEGSPVGPSSGTAGRAAAAPRTPARSAGRRSAPDREPHPSGRVVP